MKNVYQGLAFLVALLVTSVHASAQQTAFESVQESTDILLERLVEVLQVTCLKLWILHLPPDGGDCLGPKAVPDVLKEQPNSAKMSGVHHIKDIGCRLGVP